MKGLLYKEFYLGRKSYVLFLAMAMMFSLLGFLVFLSMICGNLRNMPSESPETVKLFVMTFIYVPFLLMLLAANGSNESIFSDYASNWMTYSYTHPTKATKAVGARYLTGIIIFPISILYGVVNALIISAISKYTLNTEIFKNMVVCLVFAVLIYAINVPMALKCKTSHAVSTRWGIIFILSYLIMGLIFINAGMLETDSAEMDQYMFEMFEKYETIRDALLPFAPLMVVALLGISFVISIKIYQRRERKC